MRRQFTKAEIAAELYRHGRLPNYYGLGSRVRRMLCRIGITEQRWVAFKVWFGLSGKCRCRQREQWLNRFGELVGLNRLFAR